MVQMLCALQHFLTLTPPGNPFGGASTLASVLTTFNSVDSDEGVGRVEDQGDEDVTASLEEYDLLLVGNSMKILSVEFVVRAELGDHHRGLTNVSSSNGPRT